MIYDRSIGPVFVYFARIFDNYNGAKVIYFVYEF